MEGGTLSIDLRNMPCRYDDSSVVAVVNFKVTSSWKYWSAGVVKKLHCIISDFRKWKLHRKVTKLPSETPYPGVSILKPLMDVDPNLFSNLETFFTMNYPVVSTVVMICLCLKKLGIERMYAGLSFKRWGWYLTLTLLTWRIWWAPNNASRWQMGFNLAFKGLNILLEQKKVKWWNKWQFVGSKTDIMQHVLKV
jgi:hypothetical protein